MVIKVLRSADIILSGAAYTEQDGFYTNLRRKDTESIIRHHIHR